MGLFEKCKLVLIKIKELLWKKDGTLKLIISRLLTAMADPGFQVRGGAKGGAHKFQTLKIVQKPAVMPTLLKNGSYLC